MPEHSTSKHVFAGTLHAIESIQELPFVAGNVALDFVNTAEERGHPDAGDALSSPADLRVWGERYGLLSEGARGDEQAELRLALDARELLYRVFYSQAHGRAPETSDLERLAREAADSYRAGELDPEFVWRWAPSELASVRRVAVTSAVELLRSEAVARLKQCPGERCGWFFLDATKRGNRRWCSMAECGQEAKMARRRARRQG